MSFKTPVMEILEKREKEYGPVKESFTNIASRWSKVLGVEVTPDQALECMIELKRARLDYNPNHKDSILDIIGYTLLRWDLKRAELDTHAESSH